MTTKQFKYRCSVEEDIDRKRLALIKSYPCRGAFSRIKPYKDMLTSDICHTVSSTAAENMIDVLFPLIELNIESVFGKAVVQFLEEYPNRCMNIVITGQLAYLNNHTNAAVLQISLWLEFDTIEEKCLWELSNG